MPEVKIEQTTINKIEKIIASGKPGTVTIKGVKVKIDPVQKVIKTGSTQHQITDEKTGGILPLAALIPIIAAALTGVGTITGGVATAVKAGVDIAKGSGVGGCLDGGCIKGAAPQTIHPPYEALAPRGRLEPDDSKPPCKAEIIDAIITLHKAGFTLMRM